MEPREFWAVNLAVFEKAVSEDIPGVILIVLEMERSPLLPLIVIGAVLEEPIGDPPCPPEPDRLGREAARCRAIARSRDARRAASRPR
jgi:hypothetical protein